MSRVRIGLIGLLIAAPFYLVLIDTTSSPELIAGSVAAVLAAGTFGAAYLESVENPAVKLSWLRAAWRPILQVPAHVMRVCAEVLAQTISPRERRGVLQAEHFATGDGDAQDLGRRALTEWLRSLAPNTIVIGIDPESDRLLLHHLHWRR